MASPKRKSESKKKGARSAPRPRQESSASRAMWKGTLKVGRLAVPVKLHAAVRERGLRFRLLHDSDLCPVEQHMVQATTEETVPAEQIRMGYEVEEGSFLLLDEQELERLAPSPSREIELLRFVPRGAVGPALFERPYALAPDKSAGEYAALAAALERREELGIARWVMRKREYTGALEGRDGRLMLITLRSPEEVVDAKSLRPPEGRVLAANERAMARQLIATLEGPFEPGRYHDQQRKRVLDLIEAKRHGRSVRVTPYRRKAAPDSLAAALKKSLEAAGRRRRVPASA